MLESILNSLRTWSKQNDARTKLQHTYAALAILTLVAAGVVGLINYSLGQSILFVSIILALMFIANAVAWALLQSFVLDRLGRRANKK